MPTAGSAGFRRHSTGMLLGFVLVLAAVVRIPGLFWGIDFSQEPDYLRYHPDELSLAAWSKEFWSGVPNEHMAYPKGFPLQLAIMSKLAGARHENDAARIVFGGRMLSLAYGVGTVALTYVLALLATGSAASALWAAFLLALCGIHVTQSHFATADAAAVFWLYATMACCWQFRVTDRRSHLACAAVCVGMALAMKFALVAVIPLIAVIGIARRRALSSAIVLGIAPLTFYVANGGHFGPRNVVYMLKNVLRDNLQAAPNHNDWLNPLVYAIQIVPGLGLAAFLLCVFVAIRAARGAGNRAASRWLSIAGFLIVVLPLVVQFVSVCLLDVPFARHVLSLFPALCVLGGVGMTQLLARAVVSRSRLRRNAVAALVLSYQAVCVAEVEYYFVFDTREEARGWAEGHIPAGSKVYFSKYVDAAGWPGTYHSVTAGEAEYLILHEAYYFRFLRSILNPQAPFARQDQLFHALPEELSLIQTLLTEPGDYRRIHQVSCQAITPEKRVFKRFLGTYTLYLGDVLIFKRLPD